jgi:hypothetical protein
MEVFGQLHALAVLSPGKEHQVTIGYEAGWAPERIWMLWSRDTSLASAGDRTPPVKSVIRRYGNIMQENYILLKVKHGDKLFTYLLSSPTHWCRIFPLSGLFHDTVSISHNELYSVLAGG